MVEQHWRPSIDFGRLREFHLLRDWSNQSSVEEQMTFENLLAILRNYASYGYEEVIVEDLRDNRVVQMPAALQGIEVSILSLVLGDREVLRARIAERDEGFRSVEAALDWNKALMARPCATHEVRLDVSHLTPQEVLDRANNLLGQPKVEEPHDSI